LPTCEECAQPFTSCSNQFAHPAMAPSMPTIDMALIEGDADEASGLAAPYMGHVMRFTYL
jgi:hypothetical protein